MASKTSSSKTDTSTELWDCMAEKQGDPITVNTITGIHYGTMQKWMNDMANTGFAKFTVVKHD